MKKTAPLLLLILSACMAQSVTPEEAGAIKALEWTEAATPEEAAARAAADNDLRLLTFARRGATIPGIDAESATRYQALCGLRILPGTGDIIYGKQQLKLLQKAQQYAERYNRIIAEKCALQAAE